MYSDLKNSETNQSTTTIYLPDQTQKIETTSLSGEQPREPKEDAPEVPPLEVPGRQDVPEPIPEKSRAYGTASPMPVAH